MCDRRRRGGCVVAVNVAVTVQVVLGRGRSLMAKVQRKRLVVSFKESESRTKQMFREGTRIDNVLKRYATAGVDSAMAPWLFAQNMANAPFGIDQGKDYHAQLSAVTKVRQYFEALPAKVRARFGNDPSQLLDFLGDDRNRDEAVKLGLVKAPEAPIPPSARPTEVPPAKPAEGSPPK